jgi:hypothetical protein
VSSSEVKCKRSRGVSVGCVESEVVPNKKNLPFANRGVAPKRHRTIRARQWSSYTYKVRRLHPRFELNRQKRFRREISGRQTFKGRKNENSSLSPQSKTVHTLPLVNRSLSRAHFHTASLRRARHNLSTIRRRLTSRPEHISSIRESKQNRSVASEQEKDHNTLDRKENALKVGRRIPDRSTQTLHQKRKPKIYRLKANKNKTASCRYTHYRSENKIDWMKKNTNALTAEHTLDRRKTTNEVEEKEETRNFCSPKKETQLPRG